MNNIVKTLIPVLLVAFGLGCGYSRPKTAMPTIMQLNPASQTAGTGQFHLEVDGTNFASNAVVNFGTLAVTPTSATSTRLGAMIPGSAVMTSGTVSVTVTNPGGGGNYGGMGSVTSAPMNFTIN